MNRHELDDLTGRLRREAEELAARFPARLPDPDRLIGRRPTQGFRSWPALVAAGILGMIGVGAASMLLGRTMRPAESLTATEPRAAGAAARAHPPARLPTDPAQEQEAPVVQASLFPIWEIAITVPDGRGGRKTIATGYYVPEQVKPARLEDLGPAERFAIRELLVDQEINLSGPEI